MPGGGSSTGKQGVPGTKVKIGDGGWDFFEGTDKMTMDFIVSVCARSHSFFEIPIQYISDIIFH